MKAGQNVIYRHRPAKVIDELNGLVLISIKAGRSHRILTVHINEVKGV